MNEHWKFKTLLAVKFIVNSCKTSVYFLSIIQKLLRGMKCYFRFAYLNSYKSISVKAFMCNNIYFFRVLFS